MDLSYELENLRKKVAELEQEMGKLKLRRQREDDEEKEVSFRRKMLICRCPTACRFSPPDCPAASTSSLLELNRMLALLEKKPSLSADAPLLEVMAKFELPWTPVWQPTVLAAVARRCPHFELTIADVLKRSEEAEKEEEEDDEKGAERAWRKKMMICSCPTACRFSPPDCPAASTSSLLELNRMLALLKKKPALSRDARRLKEMAKREETCAALWQPTLLEVAGVCPLFELTVAAQPDLSELLRQRHGAVLLDALGQVTMPKGAVLVMSGVEAEEEVPVFDGFDKYVVDGGGTMCDELWQMLTQKAIRRVLLVVPFHASTAHRSTWQSVIDRIPIRTDVMFCAAALSPQRDITAVHDDEFDRLMRRLGRVDGKAEHLSLAPVLIRRLNTFRHCDAEHFGRLFWSRIGRRLEELHWPRMFEVLGEQEEAELEEEAARRMQEYIRDERVC